MCSLPSSRQGNLSNVQYIHLEPKRVITSHQKKKGNGEHLRDRPFARSTIWLRAEAPSCPWPLLNGLGPHGNHSRTVLLLWELLLQRDRGVPGEHRGSCNARRRTAADAGAPEQEGDDSGDKCKSSEDAADDPCDLLRGRVCVHGDRLRRGQPWHGRLRRGGRRGRGEGPRLASVDFGSVCADRG